MQGLTVICTRGRIKGSVVAIAAVVATIAARRALWPFALLSLAFSVAAIVVLQQPMGMRHGPEPAAAHATVNAPPAFRGEALSPAHHHH